MAPTKEARRMYRARSMKSRCRGVAPKPCRKGANAHYCRVTRKGKRNHYCRLRKNTRRAR